MGLSFGKADCLIRPPEKILYTFAANVKAMMPFQSHHPSTGIHFLSVGLGEWFVVISPARTKEQVTV
jgi:hypothetical protein